MRLDYFTDIRQSKPKTFYFVNISTGSAIKFVEDILLYILANADPFIRNGHQDSIIRIRCRNGDIRIRRRIFVRVVQQAIKNIGEMKLISKNQWLPCFQVTRKLSLPALYTQLKVAVRLLR